MDSPHLIKLCPNCKNPVPPKTHPGGSPRVYCSAKCRWHAANIRHPRHPKKKPNRFLWFTNGLCLGLLSGIIIFNLLNIPKPLPEPVFVPTQTQITCPVFTQVTQTVLTCPVPTPHARRISDKGVEFIKQWESFRAAMYNAPESGCTVGFGHLISSTPCDSNSWPSYVSLKGAEDLLRADIKLAEFHFFQNVDVDLNQAQYDAIISIVFNMGWPNFSEKEFVELLETGQLDKIPASIRYYCADVNGTVWQGLIRRRKAEATLFEFGIY